MIVKLVRPSMRPMHELWWDRAQFAYCAAVAGVSHGQRRCYHVLEAGMPVHVTGFYEKKIGDFQRSRDYPAAERFLKRMITNDPPHISVLYHGSMSLFLGMSRIVSHELVRHHVGVSFMQESTRYVVQRSPLVFVIPPYYESACKGEYDLTNGDELPRFANNAYKAFLRYQDELDKGIPTESARYQLPHAIYAPMIATGNYAAWRNILKQRLQRKAAPEIQYLAGLVKDRMELISPVLLEGL